MKIWTNTNTLDGYLDGVEFTADKSLADVALVGGKAIPLAEFPRLRGIFKTGVGTDNLPFAEAKERGIEIRLPSRTTADWIFEETANFACYLCLRMFYDSAGVLESWTKYPRPSLSSRTLLVIGVGNIGRRVRDKMSAFCRVSTFDAAIDEPAALRPRVADADCITLHVPLTDETRSLFNAEKLSWMKAGAALVNTSRGAVVDEAALEQALTEGRVRAAFDVFWKEPYDGPLRKLSPDRFLMTPHLASTCRRVLARLCARFPGVLQ